MTTFRNERRRTSLDLEVFKGYFAELAIPDKISTQCYWSIQEHVLDNTFPVSPTDKLYQDLRFDSDDQDELVHNLMDKLGCDIPAPDMITGKPKLMTVADVINFVFAYYPKSK